MNSKRKIFFVVTRNLGLKALSLLFAIILWSFVITATNQDRVKRFENVSVTVVGLDNLKANGLTTREDISSNPLTVTVKVNVSRSDYQYFDETYINAQVDLSDITAEGAASLPVHISFGNANVSLASVSPSALGVTIDTVETKSIPFSIEKTGQLASGLASVNPEYPETVEISGAAYYVEKITNAYADVDLSLLSDGDILTPACRFTDEKGNTIKFGSVRVNVDMDIQTVKEVSINTSGSVINTDKLADGYSFASVSAGKIKLCGHRSAIEKLTEVSAQSIDLTGKDSSCTSLPIQLNLPEGISILTGQSEPVANIKIVEAIDDITISCPIVISGISEGSTVTLTVGSTTKKLKADGSTGFTASVTLSGSAVALKSITSSDVIVRLSLSDKSAGAYEITPVIALSSAIASDITAQLNSPTVIAVSIK